MGVVDTRSSNFRRSETKYTHKQFAAGRVFKTSESVSVAHSRLTLLKPLPNGSAIMPALETKHSLFEQYYFAQSAHSDSTVVFRCFNTAIEVLGSI